MDNVNVNKLLSETDLIDILFHTCDVKKNGSVPVSALITYLEKMTDTKVQHREAVKKLAACLDPNELNCEVDLETYRRGIRAWIEQLGNPHSEDSGSDAEDGTHNTTSKSEDCEVGMYSPCWKSTGSSGYDVVSIPDEDNTGYTEREGLDPWGQIEDLKLTNRRLCQESTRLQTQIDQQEDTIASITHDKNILRDKIRRLQKIADLQRSDVVSENEELKVSVTWYQSQKKEAELRIQRLEKETVAISSQFADCEIKLNKSLADGEKWNSLVRSLQLTVAEQKHALKEGEEIQKNQEMELSEKKQTVVEMNARLGEVSTLNKELKRNSEDLQIQLAQTHQRLVRQSLRQQQKSFQKALSSSQDGSESEDENSDNDDAEDDDNLRAVPLTLLDLGQPGAATAACSSINTEIRDMLEDGQNRPSPLSAKEQSQILASEVEMWVVADDIDLNAVLCQLTDSTLESFIAALTKKCRMAHSGTRRQHASTDGSEQPLKSPTCQNGRAGKGTDTRDDHIVNAVDQQRRDNVNERFKQFLAKVKQLQEENQRLRQNHDASVDSVLNMEGEFNSAVSLTDTRIMVLRGILQEERTLKRTLQEQVATLKKILGIVDKKDSMDFETVKDTLCRQQDKIEHLKRSNLELAEKYHKAELKITDLQEEAQQVAQRLEKEKYKCSKLEDAVNTNTIARQLDLREIWRLVQKDVETEYLDNQDESLISASTEEIKKKIMQEIKDRENRWQQSDFAKDNQNGQDPMNLPLRRTSGYGKVSSHCYGYRCFPHPPSSPLVDALTIDFFNGNYYPLPKKSRASAATIDPYLNYLQMSCEDVDCMECRAYRLGLDLQGVASCPSLQLKMGQHEHPASLAYGGFHSVVTALDYNYNSQAGFNNAQARYGDFVDHGKGAVPSFPPVSVAVSSSNPTSATLGHAASISGGDGVIVGEPASYKNTSSNNSTGVTPSTSLSSGRGGSLAETSPSALHRRMDFKAKHSGRWTSGTTDSCNSSSMESGSLSNSDYSCRRPQPPLPPPPPPPVPQAGGQVTDHCGPACTATEQFSPAGFRRMSFLAAVDKSKGKDVDWSRRPSYKAAIDPRYLAGDKADYSAADYCYQLAGMGGGPYASGMDVSRVPGTATTSTTSAHSEGRTVTFHLGDVNLTSVDSRDSQDHHSSFVSSSNLSSSSDSDCVFAGSSVHSPRVQGGGGGGQPRKLSTLHEEEAEDLLKTPERRSPKLSSSSHIDAHQQSGLNRVPEGGNTGNVSSSSHPGPQRSSDSTFRLHGSQGRTTGSSDMKAFLYASGEEGKAMAAEPACTAGNMPAHFKQRTELTASRTGTASSASAASASAPSVVTSAAASSCSVSAPSSLPQSLILVPGSPPQTPPQTPRVSHDSPAPSAVPSRLATLRQSAWHEEDPPPDLITPSANNLARKRGQMKAMKLPELSENAESDSELPTNSNGAPPSPSSSKKPASSSKDSSPLQRQSSGGIALQISLTSDDNDDKCKMDNTTSPDTKDMLRPPSPSDDPVTPSIPDSFLKMLGLSTSSSTLNKRESSEDKAESSIDQLPDKQLESRFNSLSLAFKTDRLTLEKRLGIQERSRDIAEQNIDKELQSLRDAVELLNNLCFDERVQEVISKIHHHLDILEHSVARLSSRAEVFGAVQQEKRMCLAMEVMTTFTENIRRLRDKEQSDVEEARKLLNERQITSSLDGLGIGDRRSASVCAALNNPRTTRRRSEVALPRFFGGTGSSLHVSSSMESGFLSELSQSSHGSASRSSFADSLEEPRQRFQTATANMVVRNVVTNTLRRASLERQKNISVQSSTSSDQSSPRNDSVDKPQDNEQVKKQHSQEEEAYRHGYEEGLKASLSRELTDLRDQQTNISSNLEQVMDRVDTLQQEDQAESSEIDEAVTKLKDVVVKARLWMSNPNWQSASHTLRKIAAGIIFVIAMAIVVVTFAPLIPGNVELRNHGKPAQ